MSGPTLLEAPTQAQTDTTTSTSQEDPAASLRQLALLTRKRRKATTTSATAVPASLPPRPVADTNSIQLDYGTEEPNTGASSTASSSAAAHRASPPRPPPPPTAMEVDDDQAREEGEISDSEASTVPQSQQSPPKAAPAKPHPPAFNLPNKPSLSPTLSLNQPLKADTVAHALQNSPGSVLTHPSVPRQATPASDHDMDISDYQVRPGLRMSQSQYDTAKDIVLDLLGWGVPPEYLVSCGLSREIIYYVFLDFNLRLPANLDLAGLPPLPYPRNLHYASPEPLSPSANISTRQRSQSNTSSSRPSHGHPSLPQKPSAPQGTLSAETSTLSATAAPFIPGPSASAASIQSSPAASSTDLIDMELQRRQELLARKHLVNKLKQAAPAPLRVSLESRLSEPKDVVMASPTPAVPKETVDDFLKSIGPGTPVETNREDAMDVDGPIPGLSYTSNVPIRLHSPFKPLDARPELTPAPGPSNDVIRQAVETETGTARCPSVERPAHERSRSRSDDKSDTSESRARELSAGLKRGTKRPVAADFVDMDSAPSRSHYHGYNDYHAGRHGHHHHRRRPQSFAGLTGNRRMVIHLSDTSEDEEDEEADDNVAKSPSHVRQPPKLEITASLPSAATPGVASLLVEKDQEILKMKELIARRERARLNKLAASSSRSTPLGSETKQVTIFVKQEDDDMAASASLSSLRASSKAPMDASNGSNGSSKQSSSSDCTTPTDLIPHPMEHSTTGDKVLATEAQQEQVARATSPPIASSSLTPSISARWPSVDVDVVSPSLNTSSAQVDTCEDDSSAENFAFYRSPLSSYPLLRANSPDFLSDVAFSRARDSSSQTTNTHTDARPGSVDPHVLVGVNLRSMKTIAVSRWLSDPSRRVCQYEVPGGGECRDPNCQDIHPSLAWTVEPSDEETAQHLYNALPKSSHVTLGQLQAALQEARQPDIGYHMRVRDALAMLGLRTTP